MPARITDHCPSPPAPATAERAPVAAPLPALGENLRRLRRRKGYSLERLARASGVSRAMLGQIELDQSAPTVPLLWRIAAGLALPFSALLCSLLESVDDVPTMVLRAGGPPPIGQGGVVARLLSPPGPAARRVAFHELRFAPLCLERRAARPPGSVDQLVVARGNLMVDVGSERYELATGDALTFRSDVAHRYRNPEASEAVAYHVSQLGVIDAEV